MPKHRKHKTTHRRKIGAVSAQQKDTAALILGAVLGAVVKRMGSNALSKQTAVTIDPKLLNGGLLVVGWLLASRARQPMLKGAGLGIAAESGLNLAQSMGVLNGIGASNFFLLPAPRQASGATIVPSVGASQANVYNFPGPATVGKPRRSGGM